MILPSYSEGLPCSILEGMLYGMPAVARATGGIPDVISHGINGYLSESLDPQVYADFLGQLCTDANLYRKMAQANHTTALGRFTTDTVRDRLLDVYAKVAEQGTAAKTV